MVKLMDRLKTAVRLHQDGKLAEAEPLYRAVLRDDPDNADALYLLGTIQYQRGQHGSAAMFLKKAVAKNPRHAEAQNNLGLVLEAQGKLNDAAAAFRGAIKNQPRYADAHYNLGNILRQTNQAAGAIESYRQALRFRPDWAEAHDNLGLALRQNGQHLEAMASCREAIRLSPQLSCAHNNLGTVLKELGDFVGATDSFRRAVELNPQSAITRSNFGITLAHRREFGAAERECRQAIALDPSLAVAHNNLGLVLYLARREPESLPFFEEACRLSPDFADAHNNLGSALYRVGREEDAITHYLRAIEIRPTFTAWKNVAVVLDQACHWERARDAFQSAAELRNSDPLIKLRSATVCPTVFNSVNDIEEFRSELDTNLDDAIAANLQRSPSELFELDIRPSFGWQFLGGNDRPQREKFARSIAGCFQEASPPLRKSGKPTVGFVSVTGHEYAFCRSIGGLFAHFDKERWRPLIVCSEVGLKKLLGTIDARHAEFMIVPEQMDRLVETLRESEIDMLYHWEIATSAASYLLPFTRPTPLQCTSWGIQVTSGIPAMDYYVSSELIETDNADENYSEKLVRLKTMLSYQKRMEMPATLVSRESLGLSETANLYLCAQQIGKFHPDFDAVLAAILQQDSRGEIVVTLSRFAEENRRLLGRMNRTMGKLVDRIRFIPKQTGAHYASLIKAADVVLDPLHFGGVNTTYDAISAGKATVTLPTPFNKGRYTLGCYKRIGVTDGVVSSIDGYVARAVEIATNADYRHVLEDKIAAQSDVLFECEESAIELEEWMIETIIKHRESE